MKSINLVLILIFTFGPLAAQKKVALTTFWVSKEISYGELGGLGGAVQAKNALAEDPNFNLQPVLDNFYQTFMEDYVPQFPFELLPEEEVLENPDYQAYEGRFNEASDKDRDEKFQRWLAPKTYIPLTLPLFGGKKEDRNQVKMAEMFRDKADGVMFVFLSYEFIKVKVLPKAKIQARIDLVIFDKTGKRAFSMVEVANSKKSVGVIAGIPVMKSEKILPLCEDASKSLFEDLNKKIGKIIKKADKKL